MKEAIEKVIAELEGRRENADTLKKLAIEELESGAASGRYVAYTKAINLLKEVLSNHENHNTRNTPKPKRDDQRQQTE